MDAVKKDDSYTIDDIYALPDGERAELIDGKIYYMSPPSRDHQQLVLSLARKIADYIDSKGENCEVNVAPLCRISEQGRRELCGARYFGCVRSVQIG